MLTLTSFTLPVRFLMSQGHCQAYNSSPRVSSSSYSEVTCSARSCLSSTENDVTKKC
ncbi:hypothetical protein BgiMline_003195, partial [Biomphalaria glabrata]